MIKVGLTGGIGSGKTTVAEIFALLGAPVYYTDQKARFLIESDEELVNAVVRLLGKKAYIDGVYQRKWVAEKVFSNAGLLDQLNALVHPAVGRDFEKWVNIHADFSYVIKEAALISSRKGLDQVVYVWASENTRITRVKQRDPHRTLEEILGILQQQPEEKDFRAIADFIVDNETALLIPQVLKIHEKLIA
jgi:dephospho-CoA kinase